MFNLAEEMLSLRLWGTETTRRKQGITSASTVPPSLQHKIAFRLFPAVGASEAAKFCLHRCVRVHVRSQRRRDWKNSWGESILGEILISAVPEIQNRGLAAPVWRQVQLWRCQQQSQIGYAIHGTGYRFTVRLSIFSAHVLKICFTSHLSNAVAL